MRKSMGTVGSPDRHDEGRAIAELLSCGGRRQYLDATHARPECCVVRERQRLDAAAAKARKREAPKPPRAHQDERTSLRQAIEFALLPDSGGGQITGEQRLQFVVRHRYQIVFPPSTTRLAPVTNDAASEHK